MASSKLRTQQELQHSKAQEKYSKVADGQPYDGADAAFPIHEYFKNKLLGKNVRMLDLNAGAALINQLVVDTVTDLTIDDEELQQWANEIELKEILEEAATDLFANGYMVAQFVKDDTDTAITINPSYWYPEMPALTHKAITSGRIIIPITTYKGNAPQYFAYVEKHTETGYKRELYKLTTPEALSGEIVPLNTLSQFDGMTEEEKLTGLTIHQINRKRSSRSFYGSSVLVPIWEQLQELNEIKTQLRQERIKHFRAKLAAPVESLQRSTTANNEDARTSKEISAIEQQRVYSMNQEVFPIPVGGQIPAYIQRDLQSIDRGLQMIDKVLSEICAVSGFPRSVFNLDEKGQVHVATEEKKDARYMRHVLSGQAKIISLVKALCKSKKPAFNGTVTLRNPFDLSKKELVAIVREQAPNATFISTRKAIELIHADLPEAEREQIIAEVERDNNVQGFDRTAVDLNT